MCNTFGKENLPELFQDTTSDVECLSSATNDIGTLEKDIYRFAASDLKKEEIAKHVSELKKKYNQAKTVASRIEACKQNIGMFTDTITCDHLKDKLLKLVRHYTKS